MFSGSQLNGCVWWFSIGQADEPTFFPAPETKTKMVEQEHEQSISTPSDVNFYGSMVAGTETANLLWSFTVLR